MSSIKVIDAGRFNRQLTVENELEIADGCGGFTTRYEAQDTIWAHICPVNVVANTRADNANNEITHRIFIRFRSNVSQNTRFVSGSRKFEVQTIKDPDETRRYIECDCIERK